MMRKKVLSIAVCILMTHQFVIGQETKEIETLSPTEVYLSVTAYKGVPKDILKLPTDVTIITSDDIKNSNATSLDELLRIQTGIVVRDYHGHGSHATADIRGYGESAAQNCVILIDGRRLNNIDMSNVNLNQISLAQIERIEILHGNSGVLYGDSALGGVINIVTKKPAENVFNLGMLYNSFNTLDTKLDFQRIKGNNLAYSISGARKFSQGYRDHQEVELTNVGMNISYDNVQVGTLNLSIGFHQDNYQFPGGILQADWDTGNYKKTYSPMDEGSSIDWYTKLDFKKKIAFFNSNTEVSYRNRDAESYMQSWSLYDKRFTTIVGVSERINFSLLNTDFLIGFEYYKNIYEISPLTNTREFTSQEDDQKLERDSYGIYSRIELPVKNFLWLTCGARNEFVHQNFVVESVTDTCKDETLQAYELGINAKVVENTHIYSKWGRSFRLPKTDEYFTWGVYNPHLKPQKSDEIECGIKYRIGNFFTTMSLFNKIDEDEIYYNPLTFMNENYPSKTLRNGYKLKLKAQIHKNVTVSYGYTFTDGRFEDGIYKNKKIPLVPSHKSELSSLFLLPFGLNIQVSVLRVSERYFGSDYTQTGSKLPGYTVLDLAIWREINSTRISFGVNNLTDTKYAEYAYSGYYYPSPPRSFSISISTKF